MWQHRHAGLRLSSQHIAQGACGRFVRNQRLEPEQASRSGFSGYNVWGETTELSVETLDQLLPLAGRGVFAGEGAELDAV